MEPSQIPLAENPFRVEPNSERVLAYGERSRELRKLAEQKYFLSQKVAENDEYIGNLATKRLNAHGERSGIITDVKQITKINHLPPHIVNPG